MEAEEKEEENKRRRRRAEIYINNGLILAMRQPFGGSRQDEEDSATGVKERRS